MIFVCERQVLERVARDGSLLYPPLLYEYDE